MANSRKLRPTNDGTSPDPWDNARSCARPSVHTCSNHSPRMRQPTTRRVDLIFGHCDKAAWRNRPLTLNRDSLFVTVEATGGLGNSRILAFMECTTHRSFDD